MELNNDLDQDQANWTQVWINGLNFYDGPISLYTESIHNEHRLI